jgi:hypothetical protein
MSKLENLNKLLNTSKEAEKAYNEAVESIRKELELSVSEIKNILKSEHNEIEFVVTTKLHSKSISIMISMNKIINMKTPTMCYVMSFYDDKNTTIGVSQSNSNWDGGFHLELSTINKIIDHIESTYK